MTRKYRTQWTARDGIGFLERKNIYDTLRYDFYSSGNAHCILFKGLAKLAGAYKPDIDVSIDILFIPFVYTWSLILARLKGRLKKRRPRLYTYLSNLAATSFKWRMMGRC